MLSSPRVQITGFESLKDSYPTCPDFGPIVHALELGTSHEHRDYLRTEGYLFFRNRLCVPRTSLRDQLTWECHSGGLASHFGRDKTISAIEHHFLLAEPKARCWEHRRSVQGVRLCQESQEERWPLHTASSADATLGRCEHGLRARSTPHGPPS